MIVARYEVDVRLGILQAHRDAEAFGREFWWRANMSYKGVERIEHGGQDFYAFVYEWGMPDAQTTGEK